MNLNTFKMLIKFSVIQLYLFYEFKLCLKISKVCHTICVAFGEDIVKEHSTPKWFKKFSFDDEIDKDSSCSKDDLASLIIDNYVLLSIIIQKNNYIKQ